MLLALASCATAPDGYPPPFQRGPLLSDPHPLGPFVAMNDPEAETYFVRDISPVAEGTGWRWTHARPELRFWLDSTRKQKLTVDFSIIEATFKQTGPVTISFAVNGKLLGQAHCRKPGDYHFEKEVPASWLSTSAFTDVTAQADKVYVSPGDQAQLGFILYRIGFTS